VLDGGAGTDTLNATLDGTLVAATISDIEIINLRGIADTTVDFADVTGAQQIWNNQSGAARTLTYDTAPIAATFGVRNTASVTDIDTFDDVSGASDVLNLDLSGAGTTIQAAVVDSSTDFAAIEGLDVTATGTNYADLSAFTAVETLTLETADTLELEVDGTAMTDITISGSGELELTDAAQFAAAETVDAADFTGDLDLDISGSAAIDLNVETGDGDDRIGIDGDLLIAANDDIVVDLGAGENTLGLSNIDDDTAIGTLVFDAATLTGVSAVEFIGAISLGAADATIDFDGITPSDLVFAGAIDGNTFTLSLDNTETTLATTFEAALGVTAEALEVDFLTAEELTLNTEADVLGTTLVGNELTSLVVNATENATDFGAAVADQVTILGQDDADLDTLTSVTLNDTSEDGDVAFDVVLDDTTMANTINLSGGEATDFVLDVSSAAFDGAVTIDIGDFGVDADGVTAGGLSYTSDVTNGVRETFEFTGDNIGDITIQAASWLAGVGNTADRLDFSQIAGIDELDDLSIELVGGNTVITAAADQFDGTITVTGVDLTTDAVNFII